MEKGHSDQLDALMTINRTINRTRQSKEFMKTSKSDLQSEKTGVTKSGTASVEKQTVYEEKLNPRCRTVSTSTTLPGTNKVKPPLVTSLVERGASIEKGLARIVHSMGEQSKRISKE